MNNLFKLIVFFSLCSLQVYCFSQESKSKKIECTAQQLTHDASIAQDIQMLIGNVVFSHEGAICHCDTAYFNEKNNTIDAYGQNLIVYINDSITLQGNHIVYNGNTKIAVITKDTVVLTDQSTTLYTDKLTYNRNNNVAYFTTKGRIVSGNTTLISQQGWYYTQTNDAYFKDSVVLTSPQYLVHSDTLRYNTNSEIAYFLGPSTISSDDNYIFCEYGWYNTFTDVCQFEQNARMFNNTQCLSADTIWYDKEHDMGIARHNVAISDSTNNIVFYSHYAEYQKEKGFAYLIDSAVAVLIEQNDSLYLHGDEIWATFDTNQSLKYVHTYYNVRFYRHDIQGVCDSLSYNAIDSIIYMIGNPILWTGENQLIADTIEMYLQNGGIHKMHFINNSFVCADVFNEKNFNQIKGISMWADFIDNNLNTVFVEANAECLYYVQENDSSLIGIQKSLSAQMKIFFEDNEVSKIRMYRKVKGEMYPHDKLENTYLQGFLWLNTYRPIDKIDIFRQETYKFQMD